MLKIEKCDLVILDDFGLQAFDITSRLILLEIVEDRRGKKSTILASHIPVNKWHEIIGDSTIVDTILDRLVHTADRVDLKSHSQRKN